MRPGELVARAKFSRVKTEARAGRYYPPGETGLGALME